MVIGSFGDHKTIGTNLFELRMFFGPGFRVYYTIQGRDIIFLLAGGDKSIGMTEVAKRAGVTRASLYKSLAEGGKPQFTTISKVSKALGCKLAVA